MSSEGRRRRSSEECSWRALLIQLRNRGAIRTVAKAVAEVKGQAWNEIGEAMKELSVIPNDVLLKSSLSLEGKTNHA